MESYATLMNLLILKVEVDGGALPAAAVSCRSMVPLTEEDIFELPIEDLYARLELEALQTEATQSLPEIPTEPMEATPLPEIPTEPKEATQSLREIPAEPKEAIQSLLEIPAEPKEATQSLEIPAERPSLC